MHALNMDLRVRLDPPFSFLSEPNRGILFVSIASAAESFRSRCGSVRGAPECSKQRSPGATPHVGQETEDNCFVVRSVILMQIECDKTSPKTVPFRTSCLRSIGHCRLPNRRWEQSESPLTDPLPYERAPLWSRLRLFSSPHGKGVPIEGCPIAAFAFVQITPFARNC
jgi:hypothetical protein